MSKSCITRELEYAYFCCGKLERDRTRPYYACPHLSLLLGRDFHFLTALNLWGTIYIAISNLAVRYNLTAFAISCYSTVIKMHVSGCDFKNSQLCPKQLILHMAPHTRFLLTRLMYTSRTKLNLANNNHKH